MSDASELLLDLQEAEGYVSENPNVHSLARLCKRAHDAIETLAAQLAERDAEIALLEKHQREGWQRVYAEPAIKVFMDRAEAAEARAAACERDADYLRELLKVAKCPNCNGSGSMQIGTEDDWHEEQCEWCWRIRAALAESKP